MRLNSCDRVWVKPGVRCVSDGGVCAYDVQDLLAGV
jgi:hypothetical protein